MNIAHVVPPPWTGAYMQGKYYMALAHWVLRYPTYAEQLLRRPQNAYLLMDSGTFEEAQVSVPEMNKAAAAVAADEVILPDIAGDSQGTLRRSWGALGHIVTKRVMFVPQGRTNKQWHECLHYWLREWEKHSWDSNYYLSIGVTSLRQADSTKPLLGSKPNLLEEALKVGRPLHLLGIPHLGNFTENLLKTAYAGRVRGVDTSTAFALGAEGILVTPHARKVRLGDPTKYERLNTWARRLIALNIRILDEWIVGGEGSDTIPVFWIRQTASKWLKYWAEGFATPLVVMKACGMPTGKYAFLRWAGKEKYIRPLGTAGEPELRKGERIVEVSYETRR